MGFQAETKKADKTQDNTKKNEAQGVSAKMSASETSKDSQEEKLGNGTFNEKIKMLLKVCTGARITSFMLLNVGIRLAGSIALSTASAKIRELFANAGGEDLVEVAQDKETMTLLMRSLIDKSLRHSCLDKLYMHVNDQALLCDMIHKRFGVPVEVARANQESQNFINRFLADNHLSEMNWTVVGLQHVYRTYLVLPQADLDLIKCLFTYDLNGSGGAAWGSIGNYYVNYKAGNESETESWQHIERDAEQKYGTADSREGLVLLDMTVAHELGHIVDAQAPGKPYSDRFDGSGNPMSNSFMEISGWKRHPKSDAKQLAKDIRGYVSNPIPTAITGEKAKLADEVIMVGAEALLSGIDGVRQLVAKEANQNTAFENLYRVPGFQAMTQKFVDEGLATVNPDGSYSLTPENEQFWTTVMTSNLLTHICRGFAEHSPWYYGELFPELPTRQIHESYSWSPYWYSFSNNAWADGKISKYQYRDPGEEFAEMYASYFVSGNGAQMPKKHKAWFEANDLHKLDRKGQPKGDRSSEKTNKNKKG